jgi:hypothetical protein
MAMKIDRARLFDKRVVQRNIRAGRVTKDEYQAWLADQQDVGEKIMARDEGGDDDGYEVPVKVAAPVAAPVPVIAAAPAPAGAPAAAAAPAPIAAPPAGPTIVPPAHEPPPSDQAG